MHWDGLRKNDLNDHTPNRVTGQVEIYDLEVEFVSRCLEAERTFLTALWLDPFAGNNAAVDAELCGADFLIPAHSIVFMYVAMCAERDLNSTVAGCVAAARSGGMQLGDYRRFTNTDGRLFLYSDILDPHLDEVREGSCPFYAQAVKDYADQRREAQEAFRRYSHILISDIPQRQRTTHAA